MSAIFALITSSARGEGALGAYEFADVFVQTLADVENVRDTAERTFSTNGELRSRDCIFTSEKYQIALGSGVRTLRSMHLVGPAKGVPEQFADLFELEEGLYLKLERYCIQMGNSPGSEPGGATRAAVLKIAAQIENANGSILADSPVVFFALISLIPDARGRMTHLAITRAQMDALARSIRARFGKKLEQRHKDETVAAAWALYLILTEKGYKGSDEL